MDTMTAPETRATITAQQISDLHAALVERIGHGIDPALVRQSVEAAGFEWLRDDEDDQPEVPEMTLTVSVRALFERDLWMKFADVTGMNSWAVNEGQLDMDDTVTVTESNARRIGII